MGKLRLSNALQRHRVLRYLLAALILLAGAVGLRLVINTVTPASAPPQAEGRVVAAISAEETINQMQTRLANDPNDADAYAGLGHAFLVRVRETGDAALYGRAQAAFEAALELDDQQIDALVGQGMLALARHDFSGALEWADRARATVSSGLPTQQAAILGVEVDGLVELGRYDEAVEAAQAMMKQRPDLSSYSRVAYLRELHGDVDGAITAMQQAARYGTPGSEAQAWTLVQLGDLYFNRGDLTQALDSYQLALEEQPDSAYALAAVARVWAAQGETDAALEQYHAVLERLPMAEFAMALGELYLALEQEEAAMEHFDLVRVIQDLNSAAGMNVDLDMALFVADHAQRLGIDSTSMLVQAETAYAGRPTIYGADALAWALYRSVEQCDCPQNAEDADNLEEARAHSEEALRLNTQDAKLYYHAGMIAQALGDEMQARQYLEQALAINPYFSPLYVPVVRETLVQLEQRSAD